MSGRKQISTRTRFEIFKRDGFTCQYCGAQPPSVVLHVDHILAIANGGTNDSENLTTACQNCNLGKSDKPLNAVPRGLQEVAEEEAEIAAQLKAHAAMIRESRQALEAFAWEVAEVIEPGASEGWSQDKFNGVCMFIKRIGHARTLEAAYIARDAKAYFGPRFRYFCGVCWNRVREAEAE